MRTRGWEGLDGQSYISLSTPAPTGVDRWLEEKFGNVGKYGKRLALNGKVFIAFLLISKCRHCQGLTIGSVVCLFFFCVCVCFVFFLPIRDC